MAAYEEDPMAAVTRPTQTLGSARGGARPDPLDHDRQGQEADHPDRPDLDPAWLTPDSWRHGRRREEVSVMGRPSHWSPQFRDEAVRMYRSGQESIPQVARRIGGASGDVSQVGASRRDRHGGAGGLYPAGA